MTFLSFLVVFQFSLCIVGIFSAGLVLLRANGVVKIVQLSCAILVLATLGFLVSDAVRAVVYPDEQRLVLEGSPSALFAAMRGADPKILKGITKIELGEPRFVERASGKMVLGTYSPSERAIWMVGASPGVFAHELHHHIWYEFLSDEQRDAYREIHERSASPTAYGGSDVEEDFADSGELFVSGELLEGERREFFVSVYEFTLHSPHPDYGASTNAGTAPFYTGVVQ